MAFYKLLEPSYIGGSIKPEGAVVDINDDPDNGGMRPGKALVACDAEGNEVNRVKPARRKGKSAVDDSDIG